MARSGPLAFQPRDPDWERKVRDSFSRQGAMAHIGALLERVEPGRVEVALPFRAELTQQNGYFHAGITSAIADSAGGYAGYTLFPAGTEVLTVEFKVNLVAPALGERLVAIGTVLRPGRTLTVCELEVYAERGGERQACALGLQTLMCLPGRPAAP